MLIALLAPVIAPYSPSSLAGLPFTPPLHGGHLLGTDEVGYDIFSRVLYGLRTSLIGVLIVVTSGVVIGGLIGLVAGSAGGWVDTLLMRITDLFLALPGPLLAIAIVAALGPSYGHILLAVAIVWWPFYARIMRGEVRSWRPAPISRRPAWPVPVRPGGPCATSCPGAVPAIWVTASLDVGNLVVTLAGLSFLGLGAPAPAPELGAMSARGLQYLLQEWWVPVMPALAVFLLALFANLAGDAVGDSPGVVGDRLRGQAPGSHGRDPGHPDRRHVPAPEAEPYRSRPRLPGRQRLAGRRGQRTACLGYDRPIIDQYFTYVGHAVHGNLSDSLRTRRPVSTDIATYLPATVELTVAGLVLAVVLGAILGLASAGRGGDPGRFGS